MQDAPPVEIPPDPPGIEAPADQQSLVAPHLPMTEEAGGSVVIDLKPLAPEPIEEEAIPARSTTELSYAPRQRPISG